MTTSTNTQAAAQADTDGQEDLLARSVIYFLTEGGQEWDRAWAEIERRYGDTACECPATGEVWQYMGTVERTGRYEHQFRHRNLPAHKARVYDHVVASFEWRPEHEAQPASGVRHRASPIDLS